MMRLVGFIIKRFQRRQPSLSSAQAVEIAREIADARNWPWREPVAVQSRREKWVVLTNAESRGTNIRVIVDKFSGIVTEATFLPR